MKTIEEFNKGFEELELKKNELQQQFKDSFKELVPKLFENFPLLESVQWDQYTPYFNDGDTCEFSIHDINAINGVDKYDDSIFKSDTYFQAIEFEKIFFKYFNDDLALYLFGDGVTIILYRNGEYKVEYCEHD